MVIQYTKFQYRLINPTASAMGFSLFIRRIFSGTPEISDFWGEASGGPKELCSNGES